GGVEDRITARKWDGHLGGPVIIGPVQEAHCGSYGGESQCSALLAGCLTPSLARACSKLQQFGDQEQGRDGGKYMTDLKCCDRSNGPPVSSSSIASWLSTSPLLQNPSPPRRPSSSSFAAASPFRRPRRSPVASSEPPRPRPLRCLIGYAPRSGVLDCPLDRIFLVSSSFVFLTDAFRFRRRLMFLRFVVDRFLDFDVSMIDVRAWSSSRSTFLDFLPQGKQTIQWKEKQRSAAVGSPPSPPVTASSVADGVGRLSIADNPAARSPPMQLGGAPLSNQGSVKSQQKGLWKPKSYVTASSAVAAPVESAISSVPTEKETGSSTNDLTKLFKGPIGAHFNVDDNTFSHAQIRATFYPKFENEKSDQEVLSAGRVSYFCFRSYF
ncbi:hypothetical protein BHM03_00043853, partial [Ensete ventricosum]